MYGNRSMWLKPVEFPPSFQRCTGREVNIRIFTKYFPDIWVLALPPCSGMDLVLLLHAAAVRLPPIVQTWHSLDLLSIDELHEVPVSQR